MEELRAHLRNLEFDFPSLILDGQIHRAARAGSKDSAWIIGWIHNYIRKPGQYCIASFGDWRTGEEHLYLPHNIGGAEKALAQEVIKEAKKKINAQKLVLQREAAEKGRKRIASAAAQGSSPYLLRKKLDGLYGALLAGDTLIVPMKNIDDEILGTQRILADGQKFFEKGQRVDEAFFLIGSIDKEILVCEGYATGVSLHMATGRDVAVAFNAANLIRVARALRMRYPDIKITVCGDDDRATVINGKPVNVGREKAEKAGLIAMAAVLFPAFAGPGTDFNDLHCLEGIDKVAAQLAEKKEAKTGFRALGYDETGHYFFNIEVKDIFKLSSFNAVNLFLLAPESFWDANYRLGEATKTNYTRAANDLIELSLSKGRFDPNRVRGMGVWLDRGRVVINTGTNLMINGAEHGLYWPEGDHIYVHTTHKMPKMRAAATIEECRPLLGACEILKWTDPNSGYYLAGWLAIARIAGALPVRPHAWLTGGSATGKTTVIRSIIEPSLGGHSSFMQVQGGTTEAGIRQTLKSSSIPLTFDEFESTTRATKERHESIVELLRNTWSATSGQVVKGSAGGVSSSFNLAFSALVSSIGVNLLTDADRSRFSILELSPHGDDNEQFRRLSELMRMITPELGHKIFARTVSLLPVILESFEILREEIAVVSRQRMGQQVGMLMAGWWALQSDEVITREQAAAIARELDVSAAHNDRDSEEMACLRHLLTSSVRLDEGNSNESATVEQIIFEKSSGTDHGFERELRKYGILVKDNAIFVAQSHAYLKRLFENTQWPNWTNHLRRIKGAEKTGTTFFGPESRHRAIRIPLESFSQ